VRVVEEMILRLLLLQLQQHMAVARCQRIVEQCHNLAAVLSRGEWEATWQG
jgi:hypothetical protein